MTNKTLDNSRAISIQYNPFPEEMDTAKVMDAGKFLFPGFGRIFEVYAKLIGNSWIYQTGLEPDNYPEDERQEIIDVRQKLESTFGKGVLNASNADFWKTINLELTKKSTFLDLNNPNDLLTYYLIKGGAFAEIAPNYEAAINNSSPKRWYMIDATEFAEVGSEDDRKIIKAFALLNELEESKTFDDMFLIHKILVTADRGITKRTPKGTIFKDLADFLHGRIVKTNKKQTPKQFIDAVDLLKNNKKKAYVTAYVKEAIYFNYLTLTEDNQFKNLQTGTKYGSSVDKVVNYLTNPANQSELENIRERIEQKWLA